QKNEQRSAKHEQRHVVIRELGRSAQKLTRQSNPVPALDRLIHNVSAFQGASTRASVLATPQRALNVARTGGDAVNYVGTRAGRGTVRGPVWTTLASRLTQPSWRAQQHSVAIALSPVASHP